MKNEISGGQYYGDVDNSTVVLREAGFNLGMPMELCIMCNICIAQAKGVEKN